MSICHQVESCFVCLEAMTGSSQCQPLLPGGSAGMALCCAGQPGQSAVAEEAGPNSPPLMGEQARHQCSSWGAGRVARLNHGWLSNTPDFDYVSASIIGCWEWLLSETVLALGLLDTVSAQRSYPNRLATAPRSHTHLDAVVLLLLSTVDSMSAMTR